MDHHPPLEPPLGAARKFSPVEVKSPDPSTRTSGPAARRASAARSRTYGCAASTGPEPRVGLDRQDDGEVQGPRPDQDRPPAARPPGDRDAVGPARLHVDVLRNPSRRPEHDGPVIQLPDPSASPPVPSSAVVDEGLVEGDVLGGGRQGHLEVRHRGPGPFGVGSSLPDRFGPISPAPRPVVGPYWPARMGAGRSAEPEAKSPAQDRTRAPAPTEPKPRRRPNPSPRAKRSQFPAPSEPGPCAERTRACRFRSQRCGFVRLRAVPGLGPPATDLSRSTHIIVIRGPRSPNPRPGAGPPPPGGPGPGRRASDRPATRRPCRFWGFGLESRRGFRSP